MFHAEGPKEPMMSSTGMPSQRAHWKTEAESYSKPWCNPTGTTTLGGSFTLPPYVPSGSSVLERVATISWACTNGGQACQRSPLLEGRKYEQPNFTWHELRVKSWRKCPVLFFSCQVSGLGRGHWGRQWGKCPVLVMVFLLGSKSHSVQVQGTSHLFDRRSWTVPTMASAPSEGYRLLWKFVTSGRQFWNLCF
jgi:hypothetical protein